MAAQGRHLFTSESVTEGHPDKMADQISDAVLDAALKDDPASRVACETLLTTGLVLVAGEITTKTYIPVAQLVRDVVKDIGVGKFAHVVTLSRRHVVLSPKYCSRMICAACESKVLPRARLAALRLP